MAVSVKFLDLESSRVYMNIEGGAITRISVKDLGSAIKRELQLAPFIDDDAIFTWTGAEEYITNTETGVVMIMQNGWTIWTEDQGVKHRFEINRGLIIDSIAGDPLGTPTNIIWSLAEQAVSAVTTVAGGGGSGSATKRSMNV